MRRNSLLTWIFFGLIAVAVASGVFSYLVITLKQGNISLNALLLPLVPVVFVLVGALIISRQPRNVIGWLLMFLGVSVILIAPLDAYLQPFLSESFIPPDSPSFIFLLSLWFNSWDWMLLLLPIMFIMVLFPTGRPLSRRWGWLIYFGLAWAGVSILLTTISTTLSPGIDGGDWTVRNPVGLLDDGEWVNIISPVFVTSLFAWGLLCAVSLFVRFRNEQGVEREQIKWLFFAGAVFAAFFLIPLTMDTTIAEKVWSLLLPFVTLTIPASIAIAILRYRLYDIDIIIRKTLVYTVVSVVLALIYFGGVILLQQLFRGVSGENSPLAIVISTLVIAALFNPLRGRVQDTIDQRFFRRKYDAQQALAAFAATARDEVDMDKLSASLLEVVDETIQPDQTSLWLRAWGKN